MLTRRAYIPTLDGWRAVAILLVIGAHSVQSLLRTGTRLGVLLAQCFAHISLGVDIFFALSGYLICTILLRESQRAGRVNLRNFYVRRAFRILPPILVYLSALALLKLANVLPEIRFTDLLAVLFFVRNYFFGSVYTGHFWSLAVEEHFYLFVPWIVSRLKWGAAMTAALMIAAASITVRALEDHGAAAPGTMPMHFRTESRLDALMYGAVLALLLSRAPIREWFARYLSLGAVICLAIVTAVAVYLFTSQPIRRSVIAFVLPLFIAYTVLHPASPAGRFLELGWLRWLGRLSYSLYIWQELFLVHVGQPLGFLQQYPWNLVASILCAIASYYLIEKPMIRAGHRIAGSGNPVFPSSEAGTPIPSKSAPTVSVSLR